MYCTVHWTHFNVRNKIGIKSIDFRPNIIRSNHISKNVNHPFSSVHYNFDLLQFFFKVILEAKLVQHIFSKKTAHLCIDKPAVSTLDGEYWDRSKLQGPKRIPHSTGKCWCSWTKGYIWRAPDLVPTANSLRHGSYDSAVGLYGNPCSTHYNITRKVVQRILRAKVKNK